MNNFWTVDMIKAAASLAFIGTMSIVAASAQDSSIAGLFPIGPEGALVKPIGVLPVFESRPSSWLGNAFNPELGQINEGSTLRVVDVASFATFNGPDLWVELKNTGPGTTSNNDSTLCADGCWAYLGKKDSYIGKGLSDPEGVNYGNFDFLQYIGLSSPQSLNE